MRSRILTALALIPPVVYVLGWAPEWLFLLVLIAVVELCLYEYFTICRHAGFQPMAKLGYFAGVVLCVNPLAASSRFPGRGLVGSVVVVLVGTILLVFSLGLVRTADLKDYLAKVACTLLGVLYIPFTLSLLIAVRFPAGDRASGQLRIFLLFAIIWGGDAVAYFIGRTIGHTPLWPRISPKKTVEGALGGLVGSVLAALVVRFVFLPVVPTVGIGPVVLIAVLVALAGQIGDLAESALKRGVQVKDSGTLLPGHGGMLDRLDSLLFGAPMLWVLVVQLYRY
jgi:phosphatidate cytidylyltransferase